MTRTAALLSLILLGACARSEEARLDSNDANQAGQRVETVRPDRDDDEVALGAWREGLQDEQRVLEFGPTGAPPLFSLRCDARRGVLLQRHGLAPSGDLPVMRVSVGNEARQLAVTGTSGPNPMLRVALSGSDSLLAALGRPGELARRRAAYRADPNPSFATFGPTSRREFLQLWEARGGRPA